MNSTIYRAADLAGLQLSITDDNDNPLDLSAMSSIQVALTDNYGNIKAQYVMPYSSQPGYHALSNPSTGVLQFDIHKEDSAKFKIGVLLAQVTFTSVDSNYPDGYQPEIRDIEIANVVY